MNAAPVRRGTVERRCVPVPRRAPLHWIGLVLATLGLTTMAFQPSARADSSGAVAAARAESTAVAAPDSTRLSQHVTAYYFHTNTRCASCRKIEAYSREAIEAAFSSELRSGRLVWRLVNIEEKGNEHFVADYQLFTKSLVLVDEVNGRRGRWRNLPKVWSLLTDKEALQRYVQKEVRFFLAERP